MASQLMLFETDTTPRADGCFLLRPRRLVDGKEVGAAKAAGLLGFKDAETIYGLIQCGEIKGWKPASTRGNGKYRIDLGSVLDYKERRLRESTKF
ncbi:MAG: hypothetical protein WCP45_18625 [Verrucomicrobiota bacterium]